MVINNTILHGPAEEQLKTIDSDSIDLIVTDPPYGYSFMNKDWDKAVVGVDTWKECLRVLKAGAFAFIMSSPRQDVLCKMILNLIEAGFETNFTSLYWTYASGFPKAADVSKLVDKRYKEKPEYRELAHYLKQCRENKNISSTKLAKLFPSKSGGLTGCVWNWENNWQHGGCIPRQKEYDILKKELGLDNRFDWLVEQETKRYEEAEREVIGSGGRPPTSTSIFNIGTGTYDYTKPATEQAKRVQGAYAGFQPKPAVEVILVVMKPLSEKTFVDQALSNGKGCTWLDDCRIPYQSEQDIDENFAKHPNQYAVDFHRGNEKIPTNEQINDKGRFPANLLVSDDVLNDGKITKSGTAYKTEGQIRFNGHDYAAGKVDIQKETKQIGYPDEGSFSRYFSLDSWTEKTLPFLIVPKPSKAEKGPNNNHPTVKSRKLMSYLITMGSREGDTILDPFCGSGTVLIAAHELHRKWIGIELNPEYVDIASKRLLPHKEQTRLQ